MIRKTCIAISLGIIAMATGSAQAAYSPAITVNSSASGGFISTATGSYGFDFKVGSTTLINQLGVYDNNGSTYAGQRIYLYDTTTRTLLSTATETAPFTTNSFNYVGLDGGGAISLNTSDTYSVYATFLAGAQLPSATLVFDPNIINVPIGGQATGFATSGPPSQSVPSAFIVNFLQQPSVSAVPEPASLGMMGLGLAGVLLARRKLAKRAS